MKHLVSDADVEEYAKRLRNGGPLGKLFPAKLSICEFTDSQREIIRQARADKRAMLKASKPKAAPQPAGHVTNQPGVTEVKAPKPKPLTKLRKLLYLQSNRCFFCNEVMSEEDANIEHLNPISRGGLRSEDNEVVCHSSLNETFGPMELKRKFEFVLKAAGKFSCPR